MCSECLVPLSDPSTFEVVDVYEYFQKFIDFIGFYMAVNLFLQADQSKMSQWPYKIQ